MPYNIIIVPNKVRIAFEKRRLLSTQNMNKLDYPRRNGAHKVRITSKFLKNNE